MDFPMVPDNFLKKMSTFRGNLRVPPNATLVLRDSQQPLSLNKALSGPYFEVGLALVGYPEIPMNLPLKGSY